MACPGRLRQETNRARHLHNARQCASRTAVRYPPQVKIILHELPTREPPARAELPLAVQGFELLEEGLQPRLSEDLPLGHSTSHCRGLAVPARDIGNDYIPAPGRSREGSARTGDMSHMRTPPHPRKDFAGSQAAQGQPMLPRGATYRLNLRLKSRQLRPACELHAKQLARRLAETTASTRLPPQCWSHESRRRFATGATHTGRFHKSSGAGGSHMPLEASPAGWLRTPKTRGKDRAMGPQTSYPLWKDSTSPSRRGKPADQRSRLFPL